MPDLTDLTYWFPKISLAGLPVPRTFLVQMDEHAMRDAWRVFDGNEMTGAAEPFFAQIKSHADYFGYPCFLRTAFTSGKHGWKNTCFLNDPKRIAAHVLAIIEYGELSSIMGLPHDWWAVREYLPVKPFGVCKNYGDMPICREYRFFVDDGVVRCWHPYWPKHALESGGATAFDYEDFCHIADSKPLFAMAEAAGKAVGGSWSIDVLETERGWYVTDMAEAKNSFHWEDCPYHERSIPEPLVTSEAEAE